MLAQNKTNQKFISALLIIVLLAPVLLFSNTKRAAAQVESASACAAAVAAGAAEGEATGAAAGAAGAIGSVPSNSTAANKIAGKIAGITKGEQNFKYKECVKEILRDLLKVVAKRFLAKMTESTVNWINSGFHGKPLFLENPGSFFKDIAKSEIRNMVSMIGYNGSSYPFGKSFLINAINSYKSTFAQNAQYSFSKVTNDPVLLDNLRTDFSTGGWDAFLVNSQFPQNNYVGAQLQYSDYLSRQLAGTTSGPAEKIKDMLEQGQGFLSPKTCTTNSSYNNLKNEFQQPTFKCMLSEETKRECETPLFPENGPESDGVIQACYEQACAQQKITWEKTNSCPAKPDGSSGFVTTTPGSVVANQIMSSMTSGQRQGELSAAMGNSLSAIFDALLNQLFQKGLNSLSSTINGSNNNNDNFDYYGNTLGSPANTGNNGGGFNWNGPDEEIVLGTFKTNVQNAINNGSQELSLIDNSTLSTTQGEGVTRNTGPGIFQIFAQIWPKTQELDMCLPGPNIGWEDRMSSQVEPISENLETKISDPNPAKAAAARAASSGLKIATDSFREWMTNKMTTGLPSSASYVSAVNSIQPLYGKATELTARKSVINQTLIKLQSIKTELGAMSTQPAPGSAGEATLIQLKQRFDLLFADLSTSTSVTEKQSILTDAKNQLANLNRLIPKCTTEKYATAFEGGENTNTEQQLFCNQPIGGGYSHTPFINTGTVTHPEIPLVNATNIYPGSSGVQDTQINVAISCDITYNASPADYKKNLPGIVPLIR